MRGEADGGQWWEETHQQKVISKHKCPLCSKQEMTHALKHFEIHCGGGNAGVCVCGFGVGLVEEKFRKKKIGYILSHRWQIGNVLSRGCEGYMLLFLTYFMKIKQENGYLLYLFKYLFNWMFIKDSCFIIRLIIQCAANSSINYME